MPKEEPGVAQEPAHGEQLDGRPDGQERPAHALAQEEARCAEGGGEDHGLKITGRKGNEN